MNSGASGLRVDDFCFVSWISLLGIRIGSGVDDSLDHFMVTIGEWIYLHLVALVCVCAR